MGIGIRPTVDFAFKRLYGNDQHPAITIHFLNAIFGDQPSDHPKITTVEFLDPFLERVSENDKLAILDVKAKDNHGRTLNIEMQTSLPEGMPQRLAYYGSRLYAGQLSAGENYVELLPAMSICVLTKSLFAARRALHLDFRLREASGQILTNDFQIHLLQLSHLKVKLENIRYASPIEQWACFLLKAQDLTPQEIANLFPDPEFAEAAGVLQMISLDPAEQRLYEDRLKVQRDERARLAGARREGEERGEARGEARGKALGLRRGILLGQIDLLQRMLGLTPPKPDELLDASEEELSRTVEALQIQLAQRGR